MTEPTIYSYWLQLRTFLNFLEASERLTPPENPVRFIYKLAVVPENPDLPPVAFPPEDLDKIFRYLEGPARQPSAIWRCFDWPMSPASGKRGWRPWPCLSLTWANDV